MQRKAELVILLLLLTGLIYLSQNLGKQVSSDMVKKGETTVVIDPGHGGSDPGKIGINDAKEKDVNLQISKKVKKLLEKKGIKIVMTREEDESLAEGQSGNEKVKDMKARVELINDTAPVLAVSIHQNSYHEPGIHGAQVFYYSHSSDGERVAGIIQKSMWEIDSSSKREIKSEDSYYILKKTEVPTVIVECGFLSNPEEAEKLVDDAYQNEVAKAVAQGIETCLGD